MLFSMPVEEIVQNIGQYIQIAYESGILEDIREILGNVFEFVCKTGVTLGLLGLAGKLYFNRRAKIKEEENKPIGYPDGKGLEIKDARSIYVGVTRIGIKKYVLECFDQEGNKFEFSFRQKQYALDLVRSAANMRSKPEINLKPMALGKYISLPDEDYFDFYQAKNSGSILVLED